jgi:hypothetical protein
LNGHAPGDSKSERHPHVPTTKPVPAVSIPKRHSVAVTEEDATDNVPNDPQECQDALPNKRKDEVSAEVPKFGVSAESHRVSDLKTPIFEKNKA